MHAVYNPGIVAEYHLNKDYDYAETILETLDCLTQWDKSHQILTQLQNSEKS